MSHIKITPSNKTIEIKFAGETIVKTQKALELNEGSYPVVYYVPLEDVKPSAIEATTHVSTCPHKGQASYWTLCANGESAQNAMWGYFNPKNDVAPIKNHVAFYATKVDLNVTE